MPTSTRTLPPACDLDCLWKSVPRTGGSEGWGADFSHLQTLRNFRKKMQNLREYIILLVKGQKTQSHAASLDNKFPASQVKGGRSRGQLELLWLPEASEKDVCALCSPISLL